MEATVLSNFYERKASLDASQEQAKVGLLPRLAHPSLGLLARNGRAPVSPYMYNDG